MTTYGLLGGAIVFVCVWGVLFPLRSLLTRWEMIDQPNARSSHLTPTPRGGGLAIVSGVLLGILLWARFTDTRSLKLAGAFSLLGGGIAALGWIDDRRPLPARTRLLIQLVAAVGAIAMFGYVESIWLPFAGTLSLGRTGIALSLFWIVGLTNAYNFMDGIDGLAAGQAVVTGLSWLLVGWGLTSALSGAAGLLLAAASLGFLMHNWPPARLFMGDIASGFLGYSFALLTLPGMAGDAYSDRLLIGSAMFVGVFVGDTALTFVRRLRSGERVFDAHRSHLYQRLTPFKSTHRPVTIMFLALAVLSAGCGFGFLRGTDVVAAASLIVALVSFGALVFAVNRTTRRRAEGSGASA